MKKSPVSKAFSDPVIYSTVKDPGLFVIPGDCKTFHLTGCALFQPIAEPINRTAACHCT